MGRLPLLAEPREDGRVRLRDAAERDIPEILIAFQDDPELHLKLGLDRPPSGAELGRSIESEHADRAAGSRATLSIVTTQADRCLGQVSVHHLDWDHGRAELTIWVAPQARRHGLGVGALRLATGWLLGSCELARVQLLVETDNEPLLRAAARAGFTREGVLHDYLRRRSGRVDAVMLARVAAEESSA